MKGKCLILIKRITLICYLFVLISLVHSENTQVKMNKELLPGRIRGTVFDETTQRPIVAANIIVVGTSCGATSDMAREYLIDGLLAGTYNIRIMMMGYETRLLNNVVVNPDRITWQKNEIIVRGSITVEF